MDGWKDGEIDESHRSLVKRMYKHDGCIQKSLPSVRCLSKDLKHIVLCHIMSSLGGRGAIKSLIIHFGTVCCATISRNLYHSFLAQLLCQAILLLRSSEAFYSAAAKVTGA